MEKYISTMARNGDQPQVPDKGFAVPGLIGNATQSRTWCWTLRVGTPDLCDQQRKEWCHAGKTFLSLAPPIS